MNSLNYQNIGIGVTARVESNAPQQHTSNDVWSQILSLIDLYDKVETTSIQSHYNSDKNNFEILIVNIYITIKIQNSLAINLFLRN